MKYSFLSLFTLAICLISLPVFSQTEGQTEIDAPTLGLPGDNLDLYAVLSLFQKSKTIEDFEKTLNLKETGINNLDLNLDEKVDFIKVTTKQKDDDFSFILQVDVTEKEIQDVAVILLDKDKDGKMTLQIVGDPDLYGKDYVIEPKTTPTPSVTANPAYSGDNPVTVSVPASTVVVVETIPVVQYVYSPVYVPYYPPYHYGYYPPYFAAFTVMAVGIYRHNNYYYHGGYYGGHYGGGNVYIHNEFNFNNYNNYRNSSNTVNHYKNNGNYNANRATTRQSGATSVSNRAAATPSTRQSGGTSASNRASVTPSTSQANRSSSNVPSSSSMGSSRTRSSGSGGYSGGSSMNRSSAGMSRGGSGSGGRRR
jgi:uncharacterized membrane protein YgcG